MYRATAIALSVGLLILWLAGLSYHAPAWLTWLDGVAALVGIGVSSAFLVGAGAGTIGAGVLSLGLFVLWIVGLAFGGAPWIAWWSFGFGCAFLLLAVAAAGRAALTQRLRQG